MHPLLVHRRSLWAYLLLWSGLAVLPGALLRSATPLGALLLSVVCTLAFAAATLPTWHVCRALPLERGSGQRAAWAHTAATLFWSGAFLVAFEIGAPLLALIPSFRALPAEVDAAYGVLLGIGGLFYLLVAAFHYLLAELQRGREAAERAAALAVLAQKAELEALRAQVHPHFLFNSLNTVNALIGYDPARAREACILLADYLRSTLRAQERSLVPLSEEWALCERYLRVEALRLGERLRVEVVLEPLAAACAVPSLLLQPLVENAMTHGVALVEAPEPLRLRAWRAGARLAIELENGVDPAPQRHDGGLGLANVRARLAAQYGRDAGLRIERTASHFSVRLDLPALVPNT